MLHFQSKPDASAHSHKELLDFAIAVDKYNLVDVLALASEAKLLGWFRFHCECEAMIPLGDIIAAAYLLDNGLAFRMATRQAIKNSCERFSRLHDQLSQTFMPPNLLGKLLVNIRNKSLTLLQWPWKSGEPQRDRVLLHS